jgi:hypothetical protein
MENPLNLTKKQINSFIFAIQGIGAVFISLFLIAYLAGLPTTRVLHIEPIFRIPLAVIGIILIVGILILIVLSFLTKNMPERN